MSQFQDNLTRIKETILSVERGSKRTPHSVTLVAVSKTQDTARVREALEAGHYVFGENRVQEARLKFKDLKTEYPNLVLHLIGALQSNKAEEAVKLCDVIETLDRPSLAEALKKAIVKLNKTPRLLIEVNIGHESQKSGVMPGDLPSFLSFCQETCRLSIEGLMCIPPHEKDPAPYFAELKLLAERSALSTLSMGMSGDFETAIRMGSTEVRIGTALFGERHIRKES